MAKRGQLNAKVQEVARAFLSVPLTLTELRLIPYLQYVMVNEQKLDICKINSEERVILSKWKARNFIEGGASGMLITKEFWDFMCEILLYAYVDYENQEVVNENISRDILDD